MTGPAGDKHAESLADLIFMAQQTTRQFTKEHIQALMEKRSAGSVAMTDAEVEARASSSVSLRDILRAFKLFTYLANTKREVSEVLLSECDSDDKRRHRAMLLAVSVVYYLRLGVDTVRPDFDFRRKFCVRLKGRAADADVDEALRSSMAALMENVSLEPGIARTRGLQENIFMVRFMRVYSGRS